MNWRSIKLSPIESRIFLAVFYSSYLYLNINYVNKLNVSILAPFALRHERVPYRWCTFNLSYFIGKVVCLFPLALAALDTSVSFSLTFQIQLKSMVWNHWFPIYVKSMMFLPSNGCYTANENWCGSLKFKKLFLFYFFDINFACLPYEIHWRQS